MTVGIVTTLRLYRDGAPLPAEHPCTPESAIPTLCRQYRCSLTLTSPPDRADLVAVHRTADGYEHTMFVTQADLLDSTCDIWGRLQDQIVDIHGSMGLV